MDGRRGVAPYAHHGPGHVLVAEPPGVLGEGRDVGAPAVRQGGQARLRRRRAPPRRGPDRAGVPHGRAELFQSPPAGQSECPADRGRGRPADRGGGRRTDGEEPAMTTGAVRPDEATFRTLARAHRVVPVTRRLLADGETPVGIYRKLAGGPGTFLLE